MINKINENGEVIENMTKGKAVNEPFVHMKKVANIEEYHIDQSSEYGGTLAYNKRDVVPAGSLFLDDPRMCTIVPCQHHLRANPEIKDGIISLKVGENDTSLDYEFYPDRKTYVLRTNKSCWINLVFLKEKKENLVYDGKK